MGVEDGTFQILRTRLADRAAELGRRAAELNTRRQEVFGAPVLELAASARLRTAAEATACGIIAIRPGVLLLGTSAPGLAEGMLSLHDQDGRPLDPGTVPGLLDDERFHRDLAELLRYYRDARLVELVRTASARLLAVFRTGEQDGDIRVLQWKVTDRQAEYLDNHGEREIPSPPVFELPWTTTGREHHDNGRVLIEGQVTVAATGGSLTVRSAVDGRELYTEPVDDPLQSLADAAVAYTVAAPLLVLCVRPYNEAADRYLVVNTRTGSVRRQDSLGQGARLLPAEQGLIFPGGYELADGTNRAFRTDGTDGLRFDAVLPSLGGEDLLYVLRRPGTAQVLLLSWNTVRREAAAPLHGAGHTLLPDGTLVLLKPDREPVRGHEVQLWHSPFASADAATSQQVGEDPLERIGNADLVRGIADCLDVVRSAAGADLVDAALILDACAKAADRHYWLGGTGLLEPLAELRDAAEQVGAEQARIGALAARAAESVAAAREEAAALVRRSHGEPPTDADGWTALLGDLRRAQGRTRSCRELPQLDLAALEAVEASLAAELESATERAFGYFSGPDAFAAPLAAAREAAESAAGLATAAEAGRLTDRLAEQAEALATVTDLVTGAVTADPGAGTAVLLAIGEVLAAVNRARAILDTRRRSLLETEHRSAHAAESALLAQATTAALAAADSPAAADDQLARLLLRLDGLEARFAEAEDLAAELADRRESIQQAFAARRQTLLDASAARADRLAASATRSLEALRRRLAGLRTADDIHAALAADPMALRVRSAAAELRSLDDRVRAQELEDGLTGAGQIAVRTLRDRADLSADGGATVRLGRHRFAVRREPVELTLLPDGDGLAFSVTGTGYRREAHDPALLAGREFWTQPLVSESPVLYRSEYLATGLLGTTTDEPLEQQVRRAAEAAYDEGYERGVHDQDAVLILGALIRLRAGAGLLQHPAELRSAAQLFWAYGASESQRRSWQRRASSLVLARSTFGPGVAAAELGRGSERLVRPLAALPERPSNSATRAPQRLAIDHTSRPELIPPEFRGGHPAALADLAGELSAAVSAFLAVSGLPEASDAGEYLLEELAGPGEGFAAGADARTLLDAFEQTPGGPLLAADLRELADDLPSRHQLATAWLGAFAPDAAAALPEAVSLLCAPELPRYPVDAPLSETVEGLLGSHPRIHDGRLTVRIDQLPYQAAWFRSERVSAFRAFQRQRADALATERARLRLDDYRPRPLAGFVRNQLIDEVYLPLIGDNLAKQLGSLDSASADRSGLLLLLSPPGYGKSTLLEYVADRLGLLMVRVDGPALGAGTTSLDSDRAPDAAARREVEKIVFALEAGSNVLLHLDDIQHVSSDLLQKFIPLCDAQRRIEAVSDGRARSFDLRGRRFAVSLAGNPYTSSGQRFRIPDMLANRADVWNLGEVLTGREELFAQSFLENALAANPVLAPLAGSPAAELRLLVRMASGDPSAQADQLARPAQDLDRVLAVLARMRRVQQTVLDVNRAYIASAAQEEATRTEPPFLLQGSYRTMAALAARIDPVLNDAELEALVDDHYLAEAQTLGSAAEANLIRLALLRDRATAEQTARWRHLCADYAPGDYAPAWSGHPNNRAPKAAVSRV